MLNGRQIEKENREAAAHAPIDLAHEPALTVGPLTLNPSGLRVEHQDGRTQPVQPRVMQALIALARCPGTILSREDLNRLCWNHVHVSEDAINRVLSRLRRLSEGIADSIFRIETIPRVGHRLVLAHGVPTARTLKRRQIVVMSLAALAALFLLAVVGWRYLDSKGNRSAAIASIAIMPFKNLSNSRDYLAEGLGQEIATRLAQETELKVAGERSSSLFPQADPKLAGRSLGVAYVLEGSVRRSAEEVRVDVALVDTKTGMQVWARGFHGQPDDIFAIQDEVGRAVADRLGQRLAPSSRASRQKTTAQVYALYLTAKSLLRAREAAKNEAAFELLRQATALDPQFAPAWARLAQAVRLKRYDDQGELVVRATGPGKELELIRHALRLQPDLPEAHAIYGMIRDFDKASIPHLRQAANQERYNAENWYWLCLALDKQLDYPGALIAARRMYESDPLWTYDDWASDLTWQMGLHDEATLIVRQFAAHPVPFEREIRESQLAGYKADYSNAYVHAARAFRIANASNRDRVRTQRAWILLRLGLVDEARAANELPDLFTSMASGSVPDGGRLEALFSDKRTFWMADETPKMAARLWVESGRGSELLKFYDAVYASPQQFAETLPNGGPDFLYYAPLVARALSENHRDREGKTLLFLARRTCAGAIRRGSVPARIEARCAYVESASGNGSTAIARLQKLVANGWAPDSVSARLSLLKEPALVGIRHDPRLAHLQVLIDQRLDREREETLAELKRRADFIPA